MFCFSRKETKQVAKKQQRLSNVTKGLCCLKPQALSSHKGTVGLRAVRQKLRTRKSTVREVTRTPREDGKLATGRANTRSNKPEHSTGTWLEEGKAALPPSS